MSLEIFVEADPGPHLQAAVDDLAECLARATTIPVPLRDAPQGSLDTGIWVGRTPAMVEIGDRLKDLGPDGYAAWSDGSKLLICGNTEDGTVNGIYSFLHRHIGARWFGPGEAFEFVPRLEGFKLPIIDEVADPSFQFRMYSGIDRDWSRRNLMDRFRTGYPYGNFGHNLTNIFPSDEFAAKHPEMYALADGKRITRQTSHRGQPCFSNPLTVSIAVEKIRKYFDANPEAVTFSISVNDNIDFCECDGCAAFGVRRFRGRAIHSNSYFHWVDQVARQVDATHPDRNLAALAYWGVVLPPEQIERLPGNVIVFLTQDTSQYHDRSYREEDRRILREWLSVCSRVVKYDYYGLGWLTPRYYPGLAAEDLEFLAQEGVQGFYCEAYPFWPNIAPQLYMASQKMWNDKRDCRELLDEFFAFFSPVSEEIAAFYDVLERSWLRTRKGRWFEGLGSIPDELRVMTLREANQAREHLQAALDNASGNCRERVEFLWSGFEFSYQLMRGASTAAQLRTLPVGEASDLEGGLRLLAEIDECLQRAYEIHTNAILPDERYSDVYHKDHRFDRKRRAWRGFLQSSSLVWLEDALEFARERGDWPELKQRVPESLVPGIEALAKLAEAEDLLPGGGFEPGDVSAITRSPGRLEVGRWRLSGDATCEADTSLVREGSSSLLMDGRGRCRLTVYIPVRAGSRYMVGAWGYMVENTRDRMPSMDVTFLQKAEDEPGEFATQDLLLDCGDWHRLIAYVQAPEKARLMGIHFVMDSEQDRFWMDDVSVKEVDVTGSPEDA